MSDQQRMRRSVLAATGAAGLVGAVALPATGVGIGWPVTALATAAAVTVAHLRPRSAPGEPSGPDPRVATGRETVDGRDRGWRVAAASAALALVTVAAVRSAGWLVTACLAVSLPVAAYSLLGGRTVADLLRATAAPATAPVAGVRWLLDGARDPSDRKRGWRVLAGLAVGLFLLCVFGALFTAADPAFTALLRSWRHQLSGWAIGRATFGFVAASAGVFAGVTLARRRSAPAGVPPEPGPVLDLAVWAIPLVMLDGLFGVFVWVQVTVLFGGQHYVLGPNGPDYAEYARGGAAQLGVATTLTLVVVAAVATWARPVSPGGRALRLALTGVLCGLTLVVVASALTRMSLYAGAYGYTEPRLMAFTAIAWLGGIVVLVLAAGAARSIAWLPRAVAASAVIALLTLAAINPDATMARTHAHRLTQDYPLDLDFLGSLSADAVDELDQLPEPQRSCALTSLADQLNQPQPWYEWNAALTHARSVLAAHPVRRPLAEPPTDASPPSGCAALVPRP